VAGQRGRGEAGEAGQAIVELALLLPLLALLLLLVLDFGRAFSTSIALANAAREGARYCALNQQGNPDKTAGTRERVRGELEGRAALVESATTCETVAPGQPATVVAEATFTPLTQLIEALSGGPVRLHAAATMVAW
jgi:Flp pilus assembly protein TadG